MKIKQILLYLMGITVLFESCKKDGSTAPPSTSLKITVTDNLGNSQSGAMATLYLRQNDLINQTSSIATQITNSNGVAIFDNLSPTQYYWYVKNGCKDNFNGGVTSTGNLTANVTNTISVIVAEVGTLRMVNTSSNPYKVYVNGVLTIASLPGNTSQNLTEAPIGNYTIRIVQLSGYALFPTDETFTGTLSCGGTLTTTFP